MYVNTAGLTIVNIATNNSWISVMLNFNSRDSISVNVAFFKITHSAFKRKNSNVSAMMNITTSKCGIRVIFYPNTSQIISCNFTIFKTTLRIITYKNSNIFTIRNYAMFYTRTRRLLFNTQSCAN